MFRKRYRISYLKLLMTVLLRVEAKLAVLVECLVVCCSQAADEAQRG